MSTLPPFALIYLMGVATPVVLLRFFIKDHEDGCFLNVILIGIGVLILSFLYLWFQSGVT